MTIHSHSRPASRIPSAVALFAILWLGWSAAAIAQKGAAPPAPDANEICFACHSDKAAKGSAGNSILVDGETFVASVHGAAGLPCIACHSDVSADKLPHPPKLQPPACSTCHEKAVKEYTDTVHGAARKGGSTAAASCADCHGSHDIKKSADPVSRTNHANLETTCAKCHGTSATVQNASVPGGNVAGQFHDSIHGKALTGAAAASAPTCTNCHGAHSIRAKSDPASATSRARVPDTCGTCHQKAKAQFATGQHGKLRHVGNLAAPGCNDCHSAHQIQQHDMPLFQMQVINECGNCHSDYLTTYRDTFHGKVTELGYTRVATCASCHGSHEILPASDPKSMVSAQKRVATCQQCHAGASANFAQYDPHANRHDAERNPLFYYAALAMHWLLIGVFGFFGLHTLLWFVRSLMVRLGGRK